MMCRVSARSSAILGVVSVHPRKVRFSIGFEAADRVVRALTSRTSSLGARG
jgi:hypothetical protein